LAQKYRNEALVLKAEATGLQAEVSDQWAAYQAKGNQVIYSAISGVSRGSAWQQPPASFSQECERYAREQREIERSPARRTRARFRNQPWPTIC